MFEESSKQGCLNSSYLLWESNRKAAVSSIFLSQNSFLTVTSRPLLCVMNIEEQQFPSELMFFINQESTKRSLKWALVPALVFKVSESTSSCSQGGSTSSLILTAKGIGTAGYWSYGSLVNRRGKSPCVVIDKPAKAHGLESWVSCLISCETFGKNWRKFLENSVVVMRNRLVAEIINVPTGSVFSLDISTAIFLFVMVFEICLHSSL